MYILSFFTMLLRIIYPSTPSQDSGESWLCAGAVQSHVVCTILLDVIFVLVPTYVSLPAVAGWTNWALLGDTFTVLQIYQSWAHDITVSILAPIIWLSANWKHWDVRMHQHLDIAMLWSRKSWMVGINLKLLHDFCVYTEHTLLVTKRGQHHKRKY